MLLIFFQSDGPDGSGGAPIGLLLALTYADGGATPVTVDFGGVLEFLASAPRDAAAGAESAVVAGGSATLPIGIMAAVARDQRVDLEVLRGAAAEVRANAEGQTRLVADVAGILENTLAVYVERALVTEQLGAIAIIADGSIVIEAAAGLICNVPLAGEGAVQMRREAVGRLEFMVGADVLTLAQIETIGDMGVFANAAINLEAIGDVAMIAEGAIHIESLASSATDVAAVLSSLLPYLPPWVRTIIGRGGVRLRGRG